MSLAFLTEAMKFYKLKSNRAIQVLFIAVFLLNAFMLIVPMGDSDLSPFFTWLTQQQLDTGENFLRTSPHIEPVLSVGNLLYLLKDVLINSINLSFIYLYGSIMLGDYLEKDVKDAVKTYFKKLPLILLFALLLVIPYFVSISFLLIPYYVLLVRVAFTPYYELEGKHKITKAFSESWYQTSGITLTMVVSIFFQQLLVNMISTLVSIFMAPAAISTVMLTALINTLNAIITGRLFTLYYIYFVKVNPRGRFRVQENVQDFIENFKKIRSQVSGEEFKQA